jgi:hypothetical protein
MRRGYWLPLTLHDVLVNLNLIDSSFYFDLPNLKGVEHLLNWLLNYSASSIFFWLGIILFLLPFLMAYIKDNNLV